MGSVAISEELVTGLFFCLLGNAHDALFLLDREVLLHQEFAAAQDEVVERAFGASVPGGEFVNFGAELPGAEVGVFNAARCVAAKVRIRHGLGKLVGKDGEARVGAKVAVGRDVEGQGAALVGALRTPVRDEDVHDVGVGGLVNIVRVVSAVGSAEAIVGHDIGAREDDVNGFGGLWDGFLGDLGLDDGNDIRLTDNLSLDALG